MNRNRVRVVETFIIVMFPIALFVGCTSNGNENTSLAIADNGPYFEKKHVLSENDLNKLTFGNRVLAHKNTLVSHVKPAVYKPTTIERENAALLASNAATPTQNRLAPEKYVFNYKSGQYNIAETDLTFIKQHARLLSSTPGLTLTINGHSDHQGPANYNKALSEKRARLIYEILVTYGVPASQIMVDSYGETIPVNDSSDLAQNRRVELQYSQPLRLSAGHATDG